MSCALGVAVGAFASALLFASSTLACACGVPGLDSALTTSMDSWGMRAAEGARWATGRFDAHSRYRPLAAGEQDLRYDAQLLMAFRPVPRLELSGLFGYARQSSAESSLQGSTAGPADTWLRARFDALDEAPPHRAGLPLPAVTFLGSVRAPTAKLDNLTGLGIGAWEAAAGVAAERSLGPRLRLGLSSEAALRFSDTALGIERRLGPRFAGQVSIWFWPHPSWVLSATSNLSWEGNASVAGVTQSGSSSRFLQVSAGLAYAVPGSSLRPAIGARQVLPATAFGTNASVTTTVELSLAYVR